MEKTGNMKRQKKTVVKRISKKNNKQIFDTVYRTMATKMPALMIPLINEVFGTRYRSDRRIEQLRNEFYEKNGRVITDSIFRIGDKLYHIELQSTEDQTMALRMIQYDFAIAAGKAEKTGNMYRIRFPESCVVYLRNNKNRPDKHRVLVEFPNGKIITYESRIINVQDYTSDEIFEKNLLLFLPYYIMRYQKEFAKIEESKERFDAFLKELESIRKRLERETVKKDKALLYKDLTKLITDISDYLLMNQNKLRKEVQKTMGGEILELPSEKLMKKARREGRQEGELRGTIKTLVSLVKDGTLTVKQAAMKLGESEEQFNSRLAKAK
ncbi:MAG: hypothetical protein IJR58_05730 [Lachnospiraceae bacterium]|nr:hypothetical protein [Lachnospiraceae bacterium]